MGIPGGGEILAILVVALVVFGPNRLPDIARQIGSALHSLRGMQDTVKREINDAMRFDTTGPTTASSSAAPSYAEYGLDEPGPPPIDHDRGFDTIEPPSSSFN